MDLLQLYVVVISGLLTSSWIASIVTLLTAVAAMGLKSSALTTKLEKGLLSGAPRAFSYSAVRCPAHSNSELVWAGAPQ